MKTYILAFLLLSFSLFLSAEELDIEDLLRRIEEQWEQVNDYTCIMKLYAKNADKEEKSTIEQKFLKPKWIYMKITDGKGKGSVAVYNPLTKKAKGHTGGLLKFITVNLELTDNRITSARGHRIDQSDFGTLIARLKEYRVMNEFTSSTKTVFQEKPAYLLTAEVNDTTMLWGAKKEKIWINAGNLFPLHIEQFMSDGELVHYSTFIDIKIDTDLRDEDFNL